MALTLGGPRPQGPPSTRRRPRTPGAAASPSRLPFIEEIAVNPGSYDFTGQVAFVTGATSGIAALSIINRRATSPAQRRVVFARGRASRSQPWLKTTRAQSRSGQRYGGTRTRSRSRSRSG